MLACTLTGCGAGTVQPTTAHRQAPLAGGVQDRIGALMRAEARAREAHPSPEDEQRLGDLVQRAVDLLLASEARAALEPLIEAQTIPGWTQSRHAPATLFWLGHSHELLGETHSAVLAFHQVATRYAESPFAERARRRIADLESR